MNLIFDYEAGGTISVKFDHYLLMWTEQFKFLQVYDMNRGNELLVTIPDVSEVMAEAGMTQIIDIIISYRKSYRRKMIMQKMIIFLIPMAICYLLLAIQSVKWYFYLIYPALAGLQFIDHYKPSPSLERELIRRLQRG